MRFKLILIILIFAALFSLSGKDSEDTVIRIATVTADRPYLIEKSPGELTGIEHDLIKLVQQKLNRKIELVKVNPEDLIRILSGGEFSAVLARSDSSGLPDESLRSARIFDTPLAIFSQDHSIYQLRINQFSSSRVGISDSEAAKSYLKSMKIAYISFPDTKTGLTKLSQGEIDFLLDDLFITTYMAEKRNLKINIKGIVENKLSHYFFLYSGNDEAIKNEFDDALSRLSKEELYSIRNRWIGLSSTQTFERMNFTDDEISWIEEHPEIFYRGLNEMGPVLFKKSGEFKGILPDIFQILSKMTSIRFSPLPDEKEDTLLPAVSLLDPFMEHYGFTDPYLTIPNVIIARKNDRIYINNVEEMTNRKIVLVNAMAVSYYMENTYPDLNYIKVDSVNEALRYLIKSKADFYIGDMITGGYYINKAGYNQLSMVGEINFDMELRIAVPESISPLIPILNKSLAEITPAESTSIIQKWTSLRLENSINYTLLAQILSVFILIILIILIWNRKLKQKIHERERSEEALRYSEHKAREAEELSRVARERAEKLTVMAESASQAKSQFLANMSHEIRTPLNSIIGFTELLETTEITETQEKYLESVKTSSEVLLILINDVLDISKIEAGKMKVNPAPVKLSRIFNDMNVLFSRRADDKGLDLSFLGSASLNNEYMLDSLRLEQVLMNLIGNSLKFTEKGFITVSARFIQHKETGQNDIILTVADSGIGIRDDQRDKIFYLFEQSENQDTRRFGGTGLGLGISRKLVELMNGKIHVDSVFGRGSVFTITLPAVPFADKGISQSAYTKAYPEEHRVANRTDESCKRIEDPELNTRWVHVRDSGDPEAIKKFCRSILGLKEVKDSRKRSETVRKMILAAEEFDLDKILLLSSQMNNYFTGVLKHD